HHLVCPVSDLAKSLLALSAPSLQVRITRIELRCKEPQWCRSFKCEVRAHERWMRFAVCAAFYSSRISCHGRLTPKLSRAAQWSRAHGKLSLPCGWRNEAASA